MKRLLVINIQEGLGGLFRVNIKFAEILIEMENEIFSQYRTPP